MVEALVEEMLIGVKILEVLEFDVVLKLPEVLALPKRDQEAVSNSKPEPVAVAADPNLERIELEKAQETQERQELMVPSEVLQRLELMRNYCCSTWQVLSR